MTSFEDHFMHLCNTECSMKRLGSCLLIRKKLLRQKQRKLSIACWNVRSLVENEGSLETARVRQDERALKGSVERKVVLLIWELKRYNICTQLPSLKHYSHKLLYSSAGIFGLTCVISPRSLHIVSFSSD